MVTEEGMIDADWYQNSAAP